MPITRRNSYGITVSLSDANEYLRQHSHHIVWVAFFASSQDMEMSCDEAVLRKCGGDIKKQYSHSLLSLASGRQTLGGLPLAFGEGNTKGRILHVLNYKKPGFWVVLIGVITVLVLTKL